MQLPTYRQFSLAVIFSTLSTLFGCGWMQLDGAPEAAAESLESPLLHEEMQRVQFYDEALDLTLSQARRHPEMFPADEGPAQLERADKRRLRQTHATIVDRMRALDQLKTFGELAVSLERWEKPEAHARAYLTGYAAWLVQFQRGLDWMELTVPNERVETVLDEPAPAQELPEDSFSDLKNRVLHLGEMSQLLAGYAYYASLRDELEESGCADEEACRETMALVESQYDAALEHLEARGARDLGYNAWDNVRDIGIEAWFPAQKSVARWMGDIRVRRKGEDLIDQKQLDEVRPKLEPGDIIVTRRNWYLSNLGLPGFWPHSELYIGAPDEMADYFDDDDVRAHFREETGYDGLIEYLEAEHPEAWRAFEASDEQHRPHRILEARAEGVVFSSLEEGVGADYAAGMRPRFSRVEKAEAIAEAFAHWDKPYDFDFDFLTDRRLVCTELVYRAWQPTFERDGLDLQLDEVMGRTTLPVNELVRQFDEQYDSPERQLDFVFFLDGREERGEAVVSDLDSFRKSWKRPKWDVVQP